MHKSFIDIAGLLNYSLIDDYKILELNNQSVVVFLSARESVVNRLVNRIASRDCLLCSLRDSLKAGPGLLQGKYHITSYSDSILPGHNLIFDSLHHRRKYIERVRDMLLLADEYRDSFVMCDGINYPDKEKRHFYCHLLDKEYIPLFDFLPEGECFSTLLAGSAGDIFLKKQNLKSSIVLRSKDKNWLFDVYLEIEKVLGRSYSLSKYPHVNFIVQKEADFYFLVIYPRVVYKPLEFYDNSENRINIVPGVFEMAGVIITNSESSYNNCNIDSINSIYEQISYSFTNLKKLLMPLISDISNSKIF